MHICTCPPTQPKWGCLGPGMKNSPPLATWMLLLVEAQAYSEQDVG